MVEQPSTPREDEQALCLRLTATASGRTAAPVAEHLTDPTTLARWFVTVGLLAQEPPVGDELLVEARALREAIYTAARAVAAGGTPPRACIRRINTWAARDDVVRVLDDQQVARWSVLPDHPAHSALAVVATDAVNLLDRRRGHAIKVCESPSCAAVFVDTSRGHNRRWCSMNTCGNRAKKSNIKARRSPSPGPRDR